MSDSVVVLEKDREKLLWTLDSQRKISDVLGRIEWLLTVLPLPEGKDRVPFHGRRDFLSRINLESNSELRKMRKASESQAF
jgi:hypothetical protein